MPWGTTLTGIDQIFANCGRILLSSIIGTLLVFLVAITFVDVWSRKFGHPISYAFELTQIVMGLMIYIGLPLVTARREHIVIDLVVMNFRPGWQRVLQVSIDAACFFMGLVWSWQLWLQAGKLAASNNIFMFSQWPIAPFVYVMSIMTLIMAFVYLYLFVSALVRRGEAPGQ